MTPDDVSTVQRSWAELRRHRVVLLDELARRFRPADESSFDGEARARWLFSTVDELVGLLTSPSVAATRACELGKTWPDPACAPCFAIEGRAWIAAAAECLSDWSPPTELAWRNAWLLLSDSLSEETLSPFADGWHPRRVDCGAASRQT